MSTRVDKIFILKFIIRTELNSTELALQRWACIFDFIELCDSNVAPVRYFNNPLHLGENNLWFIINTMNDMFVGCVGRVFYFFEGDCG